MRMLCGRFLCAVALLVLLAGMAHAGAAIVIDAATGRVLAHENAHQRWRPASLTKVMTAYVVFRAIAAGEVTLQSPVLVSARAAKEPPSKMGYPAGSILTLDNALKMLMVKSANDIATAVAESIAGSTAAFAGRMNAEARRLGMTGSHFVNAHGLHDPGQYSTARDLAILAAAVRREFPQYASYFALEGIISGDNRMRSQNVLLGRFEGADGMKTGFICASGFNLIGSATRRGRTLIAVVLGSLTQQERAETAAKLLAEGFSQTSGPHVRDLPRRGKNLDAAVDLRPVICSEKAQKERWDSRDAEGRVIVRSQYLAPAVGEPRYVRVGLGGATGPVPQIAPNVPIPTPRPIRPHEQAAASGPAAAPAAAQ